MEWSLVLFYILANSANPDELLFLWHLIWIFSVHLCTQVFNIEIVIGQLL